jgi:hypothetical protein
VIQPGQIYPPTPTIRIAAIEQAGHEDKRDLHSTDYYDPHNRARRIMSHWNQSQMDPLTSYISPHSNYPAPPTHHFY